MMNEDEKINKIIKDVENREQLAMDEKISENALHNEDYGSMVSTMIDESAQSGLSVQYPEVDSDLDWYLAYDFYKFLIGETNSLPTYEFVDEIIEKSDGSVISLGYGVMIYRNLSTDCTEPIKDGIERIDVIGKQTYRAYTHRIRNDASFDIDVEKYPRFDIRRIKFLQKYINEYYEYKEKVGSKRK